MLTYSTIIGAAREARAEYHKRRAKAARLAADERAIARKRAGWQGVDRRIRRDDDGEIVLPAPREVGELPAGPLERALVALDVEWQETRERILARARELGLEARVAAALGEEVA